MANQYDSHQSDADELFRLRLCDASGDFLARPDTPSLLSDLLLRFPLLEDRERERDLELDPERDRESEKLLDLSDLEDTDRDRLRLDERLLESEYLLLLAAGAWRPLDLPRDLRAGPRRLSRFPLLRLLVRDRDRLDDLRARSGELLRRGGFSERDRLREELRLLELECLLDDLVGERLFRRHRSSAGRSPLPLGT